MRKQKIACTAAVSALAVLAAPGLANASVTAVGPISMNESTTTVGDSSVYVDGSRATQHFRYSSGNTKGTVMSLNVCSNYSNYASGSIPAYNTSYADLGSWLGGTCLKLRGRTHSGTGSFSGAYGYILF